MTDKKTFVLDTNVLLHDPHALFAFDVNHVVIPLVVIEELDHLKKREGIVGKNAREAVRLLDAAYQPSGYYCRDSVRLEHGGTLRIDLGVGDTDGSKNDKKIIATAKRLAESGKETIFISKDLNARIQARAVGVSATDYRRLRGDALLQSMVPQEMEVAQSLIDTLLLEGGVAQLDGIEEPRSNQYVLVRGENRSEILLRYHLQAKRWITVQPYTESVWGVHPRNLGQRCALDLLLDDSVQVITLIGTAGTGKTLLALSAALKKTFDDAQYRRVLVSRPIVPLGKDLGYLPGDKAEKLHHWMQPIFDNLDFLTESREGEEDLKAWILQSRRFELEAVTYIRGRSLPKMFIIIDEAQNLTPHEVKTIVSRAGEGSKVILAGDPSQVDNPYLDAVSNGLVYAMTQLQHQPLHGGIQLMVTERSALSALAAEVL